MENTKNYKYFYISPRLSNLFLINFFFFCNFFKWLIFFFANLIPFKKIILKKKNLFFNKYLFFTNRFKYKSFFFFYKFKKSIFFLINKKSIFIGNTSCPILEYALMDNFYSSWFFIKGTNFFNNFSFLSNIQYKFPEENFKYKLLKKKIKKTSKNFNKFFFYQNFFFFNKLNFKFNYLKYGLLYLSPFFKKIAQLEEKPTFLIKNFSLFNEFFNSFFKLILFYFNNYSRIFLVLKKKKFFRREGFKFFFKSFSPSPKKYNFYFNFFSPLTLHESYLYGLKNKERPVRFFLKKRKLKFFFKKKKLKFFFKKKKLKFLFIQYFNKIYNFSFTYIFINFFFFLKNPFFIKFYAFFYKDFIFKSLYPSPLLNSFENSHVYNTFFLPFFKTKDSNNFILNLSSFSYLNGNLFFNFFFNEKSFFFKKTAYSFSLENEMQRLILKKYLKPKLLSGFFSLNFLNKNLKIEETEDILNFYNLSFISFFNQPNSTFFQTPSFFFKNNLNSYLNSKLWYHSEIEFKDLQNEIDENYNFNLKRVKFKPGYMTLWRKARTVLKTNLEVKFKTQYKLTKYISKFLKFIKFNKFLLLDMRVDKVLIKSRFVFEEYTLDFFFDNGLIYLNGCSLFSRHIQLYKGDFLQLVISFKYYVLYRWFYNWVLKKKQKIKFKMRKKTAFVVSDLEKTRSFKYPHWLLKNKNLSDDVTRFLEVDYITLSLFVIYEPFLWSDISAYHFFSVRYGVINLYNWKYIT